MTATDELRRLLDERGVRWIPIAWNPKRETFYHATNGVGFCADEYTYGVKIYTDATITPAQAVEATLGRGECRIVKTWSDSDFDEGWRYRCSECGAFIGVYERVPETGLPVEHDNYCPSCGRKVVEG